MANKTPFGEDFTLDTSNMDETAKKCTELATTMRDLKWRLYTARDSLMEKWKGEGATAFSKKFQVLCQRLGDLTDDLHNMSESILDAEESYIQADMDLAKSMDGIQSPK